MKALSVSLVGAFVLCVVACGDDVSSPSSSSGSPPPDSDDAGPATCEPVPPAEKPAASCDVTIERPPYEGAKHVPEGTEITYCTTPPASGDHYPVWAAFQEYTTPVEWPYLVHSMEHGAVVLLYNCPPPGCPEIVEQLRSVRDAVPEDPKCVGQPTPHRIIIAPTPSPAIDTKIAASAWGATYRADCFDEPTLTAFVRDNYAKGPEDICYPGRTF